MHHFYLLAFLYKNFLSGFGFETLEYFTNVCLNFFISDSLEVTVTDFMSKLTVILKVVQSELIELRFLYSIFLVTEFFPASIDLSFERSR